MAAPTSDERREVAEKLRHASHTDVNLDVTIAIAILDTIGEVHRPIAAVVADLIDPTCHNQHPRASDGCFCCSECLFLYEPTDWSAYRNSFLYCPRCGARVVRGGEN